MKKIVYIISILFLFSCSTTETETEQNRTVEDKTIRIEALTAQPKDDAIYITYYDYINNTHNWQQYFFTYDAQGNAEPIIITLDDYDFRYIEGEIYRNNNIPTALFLKIYVDNELVIDESDEGEGDDFVNIKFNYDILKETSI